MGIAAPYRFHLGIYKFSAEYFAFQSVDECWIIKFIFINRHHKDAFVKCYKSLNIVIPRLDRGIQWFHPPSQEAMASRPWRNAGVLRSLGEGGQELRRVTPYRRCHGLLPVGLHWLSGFPGQAGEWRKKELFKGVIKWCRLWSLAF